MNGEENKMGCWAGKRRLYIIVDEFYRRRGRGAVCVRVVETLLWIELNELIGFTLGLVLSLHKSDYRIYLITSWKPYLETFIILHHKSKVFGSVRI